VTNVHNRQPAVLARMVVEGANHPVTPAARALFQKWSRG
jgi:glutamate dehydrogenase/leucine dehydrogenase